jgi:D-alanyl-D-alanine carboxypeptidase/D-alanyl-D-alanine-endopeptidase (penicillin-binding protein 4)
MFDGKKNKPYNVGPNATLVNFKAVELTVKKINRKLDVSIHPPLADVKIKNNIRWLRGNCSRNKIHLREMEGTLAVSGTFGTRCKRRRLYIGILSHDKFAYSMFKQLWIDSGGSFKQVLQRGIVPENVKPFYIWHNPRELGSLLKDINTLSNNPMARNLFLNFSSKMDEAGSLQKSRKILSEWFQEKRILDTPVLIDNGAGLSRKTKITPEDLSSVLADAVLNDEFEVWKNSLARAGQEGTTINRFRGMEVSGRAWVKTGSLEGVQAISGYIFTQKNEWVIFTVFVNHKKADKVKLILDKFVNLLYLDK